MGLASHCSLWESLSEAFDKLIHQSCALTRETMLLPAAVTEPSPLSGAIRRVVCREVAERVLYAGQQVLDHLGVREHLGTVSEAAVEDATFALPPNPAHWEIQILLPDRQNTTRRARLLGIDPQQHVQTVAENRLLQLKRLVDNLKVLAPKRGVDRIAWILHLQRHHFAVPGVAAVLGPTKHPA